MKSVKQGQYFYKKADLIGFESGLYTIRNT